MCNNQCKCGEESQCEENREVVVKFERKPLNRSQQEALAFLNTTEGRGTKEALFSLVDNYIKDLAESYFAEGKLKIGEILLKFDQLKRAVDKARVIEVAKK